MTEHELLRAYGVIEEARFLTVLRSLAVTPDQHALIEEYIAATTPVEAAADNSAREGRAHFPEPEARSAVALTGAVHFTGREQPRSTG